VATDFDPRRLLGSGGALRAAINAGNPVLAQRRGDGMLSGVTVDLARELGRRLGVETALVPFDGAGKVVDRAAAGVWDIAFLAIDPLRAETIAYTGAYVEIEGVFVVPARSAATHPGELDAPGRRIGVGKGAAYDLHLSREFHHAAFERYPTSDAVFPAIARDGLDAGAGIRQPAEKFAAETPGMRVVAEPFMRIRQAIAVPKSNAAAIGWLQTQIDGLLDAGFVADSLAASGQDPKLAVRR
jgi:polar amino acid transport system substrate-binding protein